MTLTKQLVFLIFLLGLCATPVLGSDITIIAPYCGNENNTYLDEQYGLCLTDSETIHGLYIQRINPQKYQWNIFLYQTPNINYSDVTGVNFIYDLYFGKSFQNKAVLGLGVNYLTMDLSGQRVPVKNGVLDALDIDLTVCSPYARLGKYLNLNQGKYDLTILPWIGGQLDKTRGEGLVDLPGNRAVSFKTDSDQFYWITGINLKMEFLHFLQFEAKRSLVYNSEEFLNKTSALVNFLLTKNIGISYRYNYHETPEGRDSYNILGITAIF